MIRNETIKKLVLTPNTKLQEIDILKLRNTKVLKYEIVELNIAQEITTWSSMLRKIIVNIQPTINSIVETYSAEKFVDVYNKTISKYIDDTDIKLNSKCPIGLYKDNELDGIISSKLYRNNTNHNLEIFSSDKQKWCVCAVFTGEIIVNIISLLRTINQFGTSLITVSITYMDRTSNCLKTENENNEDIDREMIKNMLVGAYASCKSAEAQILGICNLLNIDTSFIY